MATRKELLLRQAKEAAVEEVKGAPDAPTTAEVKAELEDTARNLAGQSALPQNMNWPMSNRRSAARLTELERIAGGPSTVDERIEAGFEAVELLLNQQEAARNTAQDALDKAQDTRTTNAVVAADAAATTAGAAKTTAAGAVTAANAAKTAIDALTAKTRTKRVATPAMLLSANPVIQVVFDTSFADTNYTVQATLETTNAGLLGLVPTVTTRTATGCTVTLKVLIVLAAGAGTLHITATHD